MMVRIATVILLALVCCGSASALEPDEILVIANKDSTESRRIAQYYCRKRAVPDKNILALSLDTNLNDTISRNDYEKRLAEPIRKRLLASEFPGKFRCLLMTYGVPFKVEGRGPLKNQQNKLRELKELIKQEQKKIEQIKQNDSTEYKQSKHRLAQLQLQIDRINGKETNASVDSELSMVLFEYYDLYRWKPNKLKNDVLGLNFRTLMASRLDGPNDQIVTGLIDKAIKAEKTGLKGVAYIDSRGIMRNDTFGHFDQSLRDLATLTELRTDIPVKEERTAKLFASDSCPRTAIYCGWYSLKKYVDAFDFVDGAIGYHIASFEAVNLRDPNSSQWCPSMLRDGITATLGAVSEPYLHSFPEPRAFFAELYEGSCLVEAYYRTKPFNSWQLLLIGDPLYRPFKTLIRSRTKN
jgi:uncharacterized protein (TIGR03790 family)